VHSSCSERKGCKKEEREMIERGACYLCLVERGGNPSFFIEKKRGGENQIHGIPTHIGGGGGEKIFLLSLIEKEPKGRILLGKEKKRRTNQVRRKEEGVPRERCSKKGGERLSHLGPTSVLR